MIDAQRPEDITTSDSPRIPAGVIARMTGELARDVQDRIEKMIDGYLADWERREYDQFEYMDGSSNEVGGVRRGCRKWHELVRHWNHWEPEDNAPRWYNHLTGEREPTYEYPGWYYLRYKDVIHQEIKEILWSHLFAGLEGEDKDFDLGGEWECHEYIEDVCECYDETMVYQQETPVPEPKATPTGDRVLRIITALDGDKIVTVTPGDTFDIDAYGVVGHSADHLDQFLEQASPEKGAVAIVVRQFLSDTYERNSDGRMLPRKVIYGLRVNAEKIECVSADEMRRCHETDSVTGKTLPPEEGVTYGCLCEETAER